MISHIKKLFPVCRSITGVGTLNTLNYFKKINPSLKIISFKSKKKIFDWKVPLEWHIKEAYIKHVKTKKVFASFNKSNLHLVNFSINVNKFLNLTDLKKKIHILEKQPNAIPYVTSYYKKDWGFCLSKNEFQKLPRGKYKVYIDSSHKEGKLNIAHSVLKGKSKKEIFFSSYVCHPSMANNELSGPVLLNEILTYVSKIKNRNFTYRFVLVPETIGSICYINKYRNELKNIISGFNLSCVGDEKNYSIIKNQNENCLSTQALQSALISKKKVKEYSYLSRGSDERQYCSPLVNIPLTGYCRSKYGTFPEYHTSLDNLNLVTKKGMEQSFSVFKSIIDAFELGLYPKTKIYCEPKLDKINLYPTTSTKNNNKKYAKKILNLISYSNGKRNIFEISKILKINIHEINSLIRLCKNNNYL
tara:strand:+ start:10014 stop:11264 length:1251 start_codon:yes stop_codon:yes gene_type:complete